VPDILPERLSDPEDYNAYEGVVETGERTGMWFDPSVAGDRRWRDVWGDTPRVELHLLPEKIIIVRPRV
jgi:hypothetical protein